MAQEKDEAAIPGKAAPAKAASIPASPAEAAAGEAAPTERVARAESDTAAPDDATPPLASGDVKPDETVLPPDEPAPASPTDSNPEPAIPPSVAGPSSADATENTETDAATAVAAAEPKKIRRILPARPSTAALGAAAFTTRTPWTHLRKLTVTVIVAWVLVLAGLISDHLLGLSSLFCDGVYVLAAVVAGAFPALELVRRLRQFTVPTALLPLIAALGAWIVGDWRDAAILLACYTTLLALHELIVRRSERPVQMLVAARATEANLAASASPIPIKEVTVGDTIRVGKDEVVPLDGFVETGATTVDQSIVTGSSEPIEKQRGSDLYAGSRNLGSEIEVRVARRPSQRTITRVARLARQALPHPSRAQQMLDELAGKYALAMLVVGALALLVLLTAGDHSWETSLQRVVAFLIAASPAPLLLTVATAYRSAMANAIRNGVLFRGQDELEILGTVKTIAFDKTGTLTQGKPAVAGVVNCTTGWSDDEILLRAAAAELRSGHRLGGAIVNTVQARNLDIPAPSEYTPSPGKGIIATVDDRTVAVGNANLFAELGVNIWRAIEISADMRDDGQSAVLVGDRENVRGVIGVSDPLRPEAPNIVADLGNLKIRRTAMLTGDDEVVAKVIADDAGLREVYADLLPEEKLGVIRQMEQSAAVGVIAGAGENSPTLAIATSGIALGSVASDVTREPAGVLLFGGELSELPYAIWIAQIARRTTNVGLMLLIGVMAVLATGALVVGIPALVVILIAFVVTLAVLLAALRLLGLTRRLPRRRLVTELSSDSGEPAVVVALPKPRYVIDDDEDDDEDDL
ncbi:MAG TPA: heavy metal translocating P-type ATPase [Thermomicrobiales bacterium]|nr:heavy metal translocating P-type ATPase [Thermomicrobiales bacterium]